MVQARLHANSHVHWYTREYAYIYDLFVCNHNCWHYWLACERTSVVSGVHQRLVGDAASLTMQTLLPIRWPNCVFVSRVSVRLLEHDEKGYPPLREFLLAPRLAKNPLSAACSFARTHYGLARLDRLQSVLHFQTDACSAVPTWLSAETSALHVFCHNYTEHPLHPRRLHYADCLIGLCQVVFVCSLSFPVP